MNLKVRKKIKAILMKLPEDTVSTVKEFIYLIKNQQFDFTKEEIEIIKEQSRSKESGVNWRDL